MNKSLEICILARLIEKQMIKAGVRNKGLIQRLETARWIAPGTRRFEWVMRPESRKSVEGRLEALLPAWREQFAFLRSIGRDPLDPSDIEALPMLRRQIDVPAPCINRRNWNAAAGLGPKHKAKAPANCILTKDWVLRFRPNRGLVGMRGGDRIDFADMAGQWTECAIPERAWTAFEAITGMPPAIIITCENLGAYVDFPATDTTLVAYAPGADTEAAAALLRKIPSAPWIHFGDLDPQGVTIAKRLAAETQRELRIYIPSFAAEYLEDAAKPVEAAWDDALDMPLLTELRSRHRRIFQEVFMLDRRLAADVAAIIQSAPGTPHVGTNGKWTDRP